VKTRGLYVYPRAGGLLRRVVLFAGIACLLPTTIGVLATLLGWLPADPVQFVAPPNAPPSAQLWLGADALGRDLLARLAAASAQFALPGLLAVVTALGLGTVLGVTAGLTGPVTGLAAEWCIQVLDSVPKLVLVLLVAAIGRSDLTWIMVTVGATFAPHVAGAIQTSIARLRATTFIEAERSLGIGMGRIVFVHILWGHSRRLILAQLLSLFAYALLVESSLSYLGGELGVQEPAASWGNMLALARDGLFRGHYLPAFGAAAMISLTLLGLSLVGRGILATLEERL
jgi:peptide/nickel transport system permease protein